MLQSSLNIAKNIFQAMSIRIESSPPVSHTANTQSPTLLSESQPQVPSSSVSSLAGQRPISFFGALYSRFCILFGSFVRWFCTFFCGRQTAPSSTSATTPLTPAQLLDRAKNFARAYIEEQCTLQHFQSAGNPPIKAVIIVKLDNRIVSCNFREIDRDALGAFRRSAIESLEHDLDNFTPNDRSEIFVKTFFIKNIRIRDRMVFSVDNSRNWRRVGHDGNSGFGHGSGTCQRQAVETTLTDDFSNSETTTNSSEVENVATRRDELFRFLFPESENFL